MTSKRPPHTGAIAGAHLRRLLLSTTVLTTAALAVTPAAAQNATWDLNPGSGVWNTAANWTPDTVPTGIATFAASNTTALSFAPGTTSVDTLQFNAGAPAYTFNINFAGGVARTVNITGGGIINNSGVQHTIAVLGFFPFATLNFRNASVAANTIFYSQTNVAGSGGGGGEGASPGGYTATGIQFYDTSSAANALIYNNVGGMLRFNNSSTAGNATITHSNGSGYTEFHGTSNAGTATISVDAIGNITFFNDTSAQNAQLTSTNSEAILGTEGGRITFLQNSTAANAVISVQGGWNHRFGPLFGSLPDGGLGFFGNATAANATITNDLTGIAIFGGSATAANATITNFGRLSFLDTSSAGNATITNESGGRLYFGNAGAPTATIVNNTGAVIDLSYDSVGSGTVTIGRLSGGGNINLGERTLILTGLSGNTLISGVISDGGEFADFGSADPHGSLTWTGAATLTLSGHSTYTGATNVDAGTLRAGIANALSTQTAVTVASVALFDLNNFNQSIGSLAGAGSTTLGTATLTAGSNDTSTTFSGVISGNGGITKAGTGVWTLSGANIYLGPTTVNAGTLAIATTGSITSNVTNNATFDNAGIVTGNLVNNSGTTTSTGLITGNATVNGGLVIVDGTVTGPVTVNNGGTLGGIGTVGATTINAGGALSPGNSIGTMTITGNISFVGAGNYIVEVSPTDADRTNATTASLGGTLRAVSTGGAYTTGQRYTVINATGGVTGTFSSLAVTGSFGTVRPVIEYDANNVYLVLLQSSISPFLFGGTPNQIATAGAIDAALLAGNTSPLFQSLFSLTGTQLNTALDRLSGEVHASTLSVLADESLHVRSAILGRLRTSSWDGTMGAMAALTMGGPQIAFAPTDEAMESALAYAKSPIVTKAPMKPPVPTGDVVFWAQGFGSWGRFEGDGNAATVRRDLAGFVTGLDTSIGPDGRLGIAGGYTGSTNTLEGRGTAKVETVNVAAYSGWRFGAFNLRAGGAYALHTIDTDRTIVFPGFADRATARYEGETAQVFGELGYGVTLGNIAVEPFAGAAWVRVSTDAATERATTAGLNIAASSFDVGYSTLGLRAASVIPLSPDTALVPRGSLAWQHAFDGVTAATVNAFQVAPVPFVISGVPLARDALLAEAGLDLALGRSITFGLSYVGQIAENVQDHAAKGKFAVKF